jgi:SAM-dependent MidA family methyltransferase
MPANSSKSKITSPQPGVNSPHRNAVSSIGDWQMAIGIELLDVLPDGFTVEISPAAEQWWREAASVLESGRLVTLDYGLTADEFFAPERRAGTVRAYCHHRSGGDVLAHPGEQDITAHVNFTAIQAAGESSGLRTEAFLTQAQFLTGIAARIWKGGASFGEWTPERTRQFQTLTHPEHLGQSFRVLVQSRG